MKTIFTNRITLAICAIACSLIIFSCQKEGSVDTSIPVNEEEAKIHADESVQAEASFDDVEDLGMIAAEEESAASEGGVAGRLLPFEELRLRLGLCATITVTPNDSTYPKTIVIDFGNGCLCADGKFRSGAIILHLTKPIRRPGAVLTITFRDYFVNRVHIEGTKIISNLSTNTDTKFTVQVVGGKVTFPSGRGYHYNSLKYVKQVAGGATRFVRDDVYTIEGRSNTTFFNNGLSITLNTERPLVKKVICPWISDGLLKIRINSRTLFLGYGAPNNGDCDNKALLTWNNGNNQLLITLP